MSDRSIAGGAGMPDSWQRLWAPHRMSYLEGENRPLPGNEIECPFCRITKLSDEDALIVFRGKEAYVVMNLYPYNAGHLLICTNRHVAELPDLTVSERNEVQEITAHAMKVLRKVSNAIGFNIGINQGAVALFHRLLFSLFRSFVTACHVHFSSSAMLRHVVNILVASMLPLTFIVL